MTNQQIFDWVQVFLLRQGKKSMMGAAGCMYHGPDGLRCAVGCLIEPEHYRQTLEGRSVDDAAVLIALAGSKSLPSEENGLKLLEELQEVHDGSPPSRWPQALAGVGARFGLRV